MRRWASTSLTSLVVLGLLWGCEAERGERPVVVRDSLGVEVIEHGYVDPSTLAAWGLAEVQFEVGVVDGASEYQFHRVSDALRRRDGSIAVVDASRTLRVFSPQGELVWTAGAEGEGPGEFNYPQKIVELPGDSLAVWDSGLGRFSVFTSSGGFVRTRTVEGTARTATGIGLSDSDRVVLDVRSIERGMVDGRSAITVRSTLGLLDISEAELQPIGEWPHSTQYQEVDEGGAYSPAIFDVAAIVAPARDGFWYGTTDDYEVRRVSLSDGLTTILRWSGPDRSIEGSDFNAVLDVWAGGPDGSPELRSWIAKYGQTHPRAELYPAYEEFLTDQDGNLWVRDFVPDHEDDGMRRWTIFSTDGHSALGRFEHPSWFEPMRAGRDWVLGLATDEVGVETVVMRSLLRAP